MPNVHHAVGTANHRSQEVCGCPSWVEHWRRSAGAQRRTCVVHGCQNRAEVGAHVELRTGGTWYIIGMCQSCNLSYRGERFRVDERTWLVEAASLDTCVRRR